MVAVKKPKVVSLKKIQEREVTSAVKKYLELRSWRPIRFQRTVMSGSFQSGEPGQSDFLFVRYDNADPLSPPCLSRAFWIEFKSPTGHLGPKQEAWIERERGRGAIVLVVDDFEWFRNWYERTFGVCGQMRLS